MSKSEFSIEKLMSCYYKPSNILYFIVVSKFLNFAKGLERFLIIGWVVGWNWWEKVQIKTQASSIPKRWFTRENWSNWSKEWDSWKKKKKKKRRKFKTFELVKVKIHHLGPIKIYCGEKTQLVRKPFLLLLWSF